MFDSNGKMVSSPNTGAKIISNIESQDSKPVAVVQDYPAETKEDKDKPEPAIKRIAPEGDSSRVRTGLKGFDDLIDGGFERESIVLVVGSAGTGKTLLSLQFLYKGAKEFNEPGVFLSFEEEKESLYKHALQFGWDFADLEKKNLFKLLVFKPHQVTAILEEGGGQIRDALIDVGAKRVVVDSITAYGLLFRDEYKRREKILEFFNMLRKWGVTALIICEDNPAEVEKEEGGIGFISDAILSMYYHHDEERGIRIHSLEVVKMRGTQHTNRLCAINFEKEGIAVYPEVEVF